MAQITFKATDEDFNNTIAPCFCRERAIPQIQEEIDGVPQTNEDGTPKMVDQYTPEEHIRLFLVECAKRVILRGRNKLVLDGDPIDQTTLDNILNNL